MKNGSHVANGMIDQSRNDDVVTVTLNNPTKLNAMTKAMWEGFAGIWTDLSADESIRCVVVTGAGARGFCPGNDIGEFDAERSNAVKARALSEIMNRGRTAMLACPHPIIARIGGACVGGGLEIAAMCDMRIAARSAKFGAPLNRIGLSMAYEEMLPIWRLTDQPTMFEMLVVGTLFDADEAKARGLINRVVADAVLDQAVEETVAAIVNGPPLVNRWHKKFFKRLEMNTPLTEDDLDEHYLSFETEDYRIGYKSFLSKSTPKFKGR